MVKVDITPVLPEVDDSSWDLRHAVMLDLMREYASDTDIYVTVASGVKIVALAQVGRSERGYTELKALVSVFPGCGSLALGKSIEIARSRGEPLFLVSLPESRGFYQKCPVLRESYAGVFEA